MGSGREPKQDERGLSARYLALVFLMGVAACGVFFSLGFLVGYNERPSRGVPAAEPVSPPSVIPPPVNAGGAKPELPKESVTPSPGAAVPATAAGQAPGEAEERPAPEPARDASPPKEPPAAQPGEEVAPAFTVQVAASRDHRDVERMVKELRARGYAVFLVTPEYARASDNLFRVQVGPFSTREDAEKVRDKLAREGFKPFIRR